MTALQSVLSHDMVWKLGWVLVHSLWQMALVGDTTSTQRVQYALDYLARHWNDANTDPGWKGSGGPVSHLAMFSLMKALIMLDIDTFDGIDWFSDFSSALLAEQNCDGSFPSPGWPENGVHGCLDTEKSEKYRLVFR